MLVTEMLGPTLQDYFLHCNKEFNVSTSVILAFKMVPSRDQIEVVEALHARNFVSKNIGPENFCFGIGDKSHTLMMQTFGTASLFKDPFSKNHVGYSEENIVVNFSIYTSINVLAGIGKLALKRILATRRPRIGRLSAAVVRQVEVASVSETRDAGLAPRHPLRAQGVDPHRGLVRPLADW